MTPANSQSASEPSTAPSSAAQTRCRFMAVLPSGDDSTAALAALAGLLRRHEIVERLVVGEVEAPAGAPGEAVAILDFQPRVADEGAELVGREELVPIVGAARNPPGAFADDHQHQPRPGGAVRRGEDQQPAGLQRVGEA